MTAVNLNNLLLQLYGKICDAAVILETRPPAPESPTSTSISPNKLQHCLVVVDLLKQQIRQTENEYRKLETLLQKQQQDIRKHISVQQQLKLHGQSLQQQLDQSQKGRKSLLDETKKMLIQLKRQNQKLLHDNEELRREIQELKMGKSPKILENRHNRTNSSKADDSGRRLKTQYHEKKIQKSPQTSQRKHNLSVESIKGKSKQRPSSLRKGSGIPSGYLRTGSKQKSYNILTTSIHRSSVGKKINSKKKPKTNKTREPKKEKSMYGHFTSKNRHMDSQDKTQGPSSVPFYRPHNRYEI